MSAAAVFNNVARNAPRMMQLHRTKDSIRSMRKAVDSSGLTVGFVPTMGALHEGHLSLVREARDQNDVVVASIFVNPTQFGPNEDLNKYPRQLERDSELLANMGVDHLFAPDAQSMYGENHMTFVEPEGFDNIPEGIVRPGHFRGVATVVTKLFNIVRPDRAYFGQKDAAQCVLIQRIVEDLDMETEILVKDTIREPDGLAMSSRNAYLTLAERKAAPIIFRALSTAREMFYERCQQQSHVPSGELVQIVERILRSEPLVHEIQYVSVDSKSTMQPITQVVRGQGAVISLACKVGNVRLIDNIVL